jgi:hypothetical protein
MRGAHGRVPVTGGTLVVDRVGGRRRVRMSEIENLGGVLHEIRRAVPKADSRRAVVDGLIEGAAVPDPKYGGPDVDAALDRLARSRPSPELTYRRVQVLAALTLALPDRFGPEGTDRQRVVAALRPATRDRSQRLAAAAHALAWDRVNEKQDARETKRSLFMMGFADRVLDVVIESGTAILSSPEGTRARLLRTAVLPGFDVEHVDQLLEPTTWGKLSGGRITITPLRMLADGKAREYDEVFVVGPRLRLTPRLRFIRHAPVETPAGTAQWLEYRMAAKQSEGELVRVDQGSIVIRPVGDGVRVETTKRVLLTSPFDAPSLAMQARALGYSDAFEQMVRTAVRTAAERAT